jgi:hypothetical protein
MTRACDFVESFTSINGFRDAISGILEGQSQYAAEAVFVFDE